VTSDIFQNPTCEAYFEKHSEAPRGKPRGSLLRRSKASGPTPPEQSSWLRRPDCEGWIFARLGGASGEAWAEPCEAQNAIPPCGKPQGFLAKKGKILSAKV